MSKSIIQNYKDNNCYLCTLLLNDPWEKPVLQEHHIFGGANRKRSERYGLKVRLCFDHHGGKGDNDVHRPDKNDYGELLKIIGQKVFELKFGHERFMEEFNRDYLSGLEDKNTDG